MSPKDTIKEQAHQLAERTALSAREAEVVLHKEISDNRTYNKDIADDLGINSSTVSDHLSSAKEKLENDAIGETYWQFYHPLGEGMDVRYRKQFDVQDGRGKLVLFENIFHEQKPTDNRFFVVHSHPEKASSDVRGVRRTRLVTDWYPFQTPEQVAKGVLEAVSFDKSGLVGSLRRDMFIDEFEDRFGFNPEEVEDAFSFDGFSAQDIPESHRTLFLPTDTDSDVAEKLAEKYDKFAAFFDMQDVENLQFKNPQTNDNATIVAESYDTGAKAVLTLDDEVYLIRGNHCDCGHVNDYSSKMGEPSKSSYNRRRDESCEHEVATLNATDIERELSGSGIEAPEDAEHSPCCPVCGYTGVTERKMRNRGQWVMSEYSCALCNEKHGSD